MADQSGRAENLQRSGSGSRALARMLAASGQHREAKEQIERFLLQDPESADALEVYADILWAVRDFAAIEAHFAALSDSQNPDVRALATIQLAHVRMERGLYSEAAEQLREGIVDSLTARCCGRLLGQLWEFLGRCQFRLRATDAARQSLHTAVSILEASGSREGVADALTVLALIEKCSDRWDRSEALTLQAVETYRDSSKPFKVLAATNNLAVLRIFRGWFESAMDPAHRAIRLAEEVGDLRLRTGTRIMLAVLQIRTERFLEARKTLAEALGLARTQATPRYRALACEYAGELALREGRLDDARRWLARGSVAAALNPDNDVLGEIDARAAEVALAEGAETKALELVDRALTRFTKANDAYEIAVARRVRGEILIAMGRGEEARGELLEAQDFLARISERFESVRVTNLLQRLEGRRTSEADTATSVDSATESEPSLTLPVARRAGRPKRRPTALAGHPAFPEIIGASPVWLAFLDRVARIAEVDAPVVILGETGTGKELIARAIHRLSRRASASFSPYNCGGGSADLIDADLFGHVRGAFTGATNERAGLVRTSRGGTLFLDEIGDLSLELQTKLLRLLQDGEIQVLGMDRQERVDLRIVCATHRNLEESIERGTFRQDLFHRLTLRVQVPPLRDRKADIPMLVEHLVLEARERGCPEFAGVHPEALVAMQTYDWPGNVRELRNVVLELAVRTPAGERARSWKAPPRRAGSGPTRFGPLSRDVIERELREANGAIVVVSERLGISRQRLYRLCQHFGIDYSTYR